MKPKKGKEKKRDRGKIGNMAPVLPLIRTDYLGNRDRSWDDEFITSPLHGEKFAREFGNMKCEITFNPSIDDAQKSWIGVIGSIHLNEQSFKKCRRILREVHKDFPKSRELKIIHDLIKKRDDDFDKMYDELMNQVSKLSKEKDQDNLRLMQLSSSARDKLGRWEEDYQMIKTLLLAILEGHSVMNKLSSPL